MPTQVFLHNFWAVLGLVFDAMIDHFAIRCLKTVSLTSMALHDIAYLEKFSGLLEFKTEREMNIEAILW